MRSPKELDKALDRLERRRAAANADAVPDSWLEFEHFASLTRARTAKGVRNIQLFEWQKELAIAAREGSVVVTKSRQTGASQWLIIYALWWALANPGAMVLIVSKSFGDASLLTRRMRRAITGLNHPAATPISDSLSLVHFPNDSQIMFKSASPPEVTGRGVDGISLLIVDEAAWCEDLGTALGTLGPALAASDNPRMLLISTPNGRSGVYWEKLVEGSSPEKMEAVFADARSPGSAGYSITQVANGLTKFVVHWSAITRYRDEAAFLERMRREFALTESTILREFELDFTEAAASVFDFALIEDCLGDPLDKAAMPQGDHLYWAGVDPSGMGQDYAVCVVLGERPDKTIYVAALYRRRGLASSVHLSSILQLLQQWHVVEAVVETNAMGQSWLERLGEAKGAPRVSGYTTTGASKHSLIGRLVVGLESGALEIPRDSIIKSELLAYQRDGQRMGAAPGHHDDTVMALAIAASASCLNTGLERFAGRIAPVSVDGISDLFDADMLLPN